MAREATTAAQLRSTTNLWFHPYISRADGCRILEGRESGAFIMRESSKGGAYALSVVLPSGEGLGHYLVEKRGPTCFRLQGSENTFMSLDELLAHYCDNDSIGMPCRLRPPRQPVPPKSPARPALPPRNSFRGHSPSTRSRPSTGSVSQPAGLPPAPAGGLPPPGSYQHNTPAFSSSPNMLLQPPGSPSMHAQDAADQDEEYAEMSSPGSRPNLPTVGSPAATLPDEDLEEEYADMSSTSSAVRMHSISGPSVADEQAEEEYTDMASAVNMASGADPIHRNSTANVISSASGSPAGHCPMDEDEEVYMDMQSGQ